MVVRCPLGRNHQANTDLLIARKRR